MEIKVSYKELVSVMNFSSGILSDKMVDDKMKNVIFMVSEGAVKVCFYNALTFCRTELQTVEKNIEGKDEWIFQVKAADLTKLLSGFTNLFKTEVEEVLFVESMNKIQLQITEKALKEEDSRMNQVSHFSLDNVPIIESVLKEIKTEFPEDCEMVQSGDVLLYVDSLLPLMSNESANSIGSKINFAEDYVFILSSYMSVFFKNRLPGAFKNMTLGYSSVSFLKKLCDLGEMLVKRDDKYLYVSVGSTESFMRHQRVKVKHDKYVSLFKKDNGIMLNRLYLKDVLRRMGSVSPEGKCTIQENGDLSVENSAFSQVIPVDKTKGEVAGISFKVSVTILEKLIVGKDNLFPEDMFIYLSKAGSGYSIFFTDSTGAWFSQAQVR
jgi:hypothetical protein